MDRRSPLPRLFFVELRAAHNDHDDSDDGGDDNAAVGWGTVSGGSFEKAQVPASCVYHVERG